MREGHVSQTVCRSVFLFWLLMGACRYRMGRAFDVWRDLDLSCGFPTNSEDYGRDLFQTSSDTPYKKFFSYCPP